MEAYVKRFSDYRTIKKGTALSYALVLDALDYQNSTVTVKGTHIRRENTGDWLSIDGLLYRILTVKPQGDRTMLTLTSVLDAFDRSLLPPSGPAPKWIGAAITNLLTDNWIQCPDPDFAVPYLTILDEDATPYVPPQIDRSGLWKLPDYIRLCRRLHRVQVTFTDSGNGIFCRIRQSPETRHQIVFDDGHSQLEQVDYSAASLTKVTVFRDTEVKGDDGSTSVTHEEGTWYLSEDGQVSQAIPSRRAAGRWDLMEAKGKGALEETAAAAFAKNKSSHKIEFYSDKDLAVGDRCSFMVYDDLMTSEIAYKRVTSEDNRYYYRSGELATTAADKLRAIKEGQYE